MSDVDDATVRASVASTPALTITVADENYTVEPTDAPITIGRVFPAQVQVNDKRISRTHLRLETRGAQWVAVDHSSNGVFLDRQAVPSVIVTNGLMLHLGHPEGIAVTFHLGAPAEREAAAGGPGRDTDGESDDDDGFDDEVGETTGESEYTDPGVVRAGAAVAARRQELNIAQRTLARDKVMNAGALISFEKGRSWPRQTTLARLEEALRWPLGTISRIRWGEDTGSEDAGERTVAMTNTVEAPFMVQAVQLALDTMRHQVDLLPEPSDPDFTQRVGMVLSDLRKLESVASNAARTTKGAPEVILVLSAVRRQYRDVMLRAARSPRATLGQQVFAARQRAELSVDEAANAAGVSVEVLTAVEADAPVSGDAVAAVRRLLSSLTRA
ncbi:FHA domain-containing protein [Mycolicibacterium sp. P1-18]|uniref:FHA domain-containing protein n=1 Tax=Mycolicibacterium sp. P1-18 TaxID=2024615 RepID=UPI0011F201E4|nr:FHA domain-containing protein [Mycolicibacterium sp. P1-18]KAA0093652.1 FHA domain-containing protein [Mycolicibacterium sp. P1-18]